MSSKFDLKPNPTTEPERRYITPEVDTGSVKIDVAVNALKTLTAMLEQETLSPADVKDVLTQTVYALQGLASQVETLEKELTEYKDNFNLYANRSLELQLQQLADIKIKNDRVKQTCDVIDRELK